MSHVPHESNSRVNFATRCVVFYDRQPNTQQRLTYFQAADVSLTKATWSPFPRGVGRGDTSRGVYLTFVEHLPDLYTTRRCRVVTSSLNFNTHLKDASALARALRKSSRHSHHQSMHSLRQNYHESDIHHCHHHQCCVRRRQLQMIQKCCLARLGVAARRVLLRSQSIPRPLVRF